LNRTLHVAGLVEAVRSVAASSFKLYTLGFAYAEIDVRYWPKADIPSCIAHVRSWG